MDEAFSKESLNFYHLSLELSSTSLAWAVLDKNSNKYLALEYLDAATRDNKGHEQLQAWIKAHELLALPFSSFSIAYLTPYATLVPEGVFKKEDLTQYTAVNFAESDLAVQFQFINNQGIVAVYGFAYDALELVQKYFPSSREFHHSGVLLNAILHANRGNEEVAITVNIHDSSFDLLITRGKQLLMFNTFSYKTKEDYIYFLLNACSQLHVNLETSALTLYGRVEKSSQIADITRTYIKQVAFGERPAQFKYSHKMMELPGHYFYNLFSQYLCV